MIWGVFLGASVMAQALAHILSRAFMRRAEHDTWAYAANSQILTAGVVGLYVLLSGQFELPPILDLWPWFLMTIVLNVVANIAQFEALKTAEASSFTIFASFRVLVSMLAAVLLIHEVVTLWQAIGAVVMIAAITIAFSHRLSFQYHPWMLPASLYALSSGLVFIGDARLVAESPSVATYMIFAFGLPGVATACIRPRILPAMLAIARSREILPMIGFSAVYGFMAVTLWLAYQAGADASQMAPIRQASIILTIVLALIFLKERDHIPQKIAATILAVIAVSLIV